MGRGELSGIACNRARSYPKNLAEFKAEGGTSPSALYIYTEDTMIGNYYKHRMEELRHDRDKTGSAI